MSVSNGGARCSGETDTRGREVALEVDTDGKDAPTYFSTDYREKRADGLKTGCAEAATVHVDDEWPLTVRATTEQNIRVEYTVAPRVHNE